MANILINSLIIRPWLHSYECMHYALCNDNRLTHKDIHFKDSKHCIIWLFLLKMTSHKVQYVFVFVCINVGASIMHWCYISTLLHYALVNSSIILDDFSHWQFHPTRCNVLFWVCMHYVLCTIFHKLCNPSWIMH